MKKLNLIVAHSKNNGIGYKNDLPWPMNKEDMKRFADITKRTTDNKKMNAVIMGMNTWNSLPNKFKPLPSRYNIILSKSANIKLDKASSFSNLESAIYFANENKEIESMYIIGGESIYNEAIKKLNIDNLYITELEKEYTCDKFFPTFDKYKYKLTENIKKDDISLKTYTNICNVNSNENQYLDLVRKIINTGDEYNGRNGKVYSIFGDQHTFDLEKGFPLLTTKKMFFKGIFEELIFFINGHTDSNILKNKGVNIWNGNTTREFLDSRKLHDYREGDMGPMYGWNWRHFGTNYENCDTNYENKGFDQLHNLIKNLIQDPTSRRHLLTTYDPSKVDEAVLAPCHGLTVQFNISNNKLNCKMYQRSVDTALGYPYNIASYALFVHLICHVTGYIPGKLIMTLGDTHIYAEHLSELKTQLDRVTLTQPNLIIKKQIDLNESIENKIKYLENLSYDDVELSNYYSYPVIKMSMVA